ncbi:Uncharacterized protein Fot_48627 [Forsythia ovata]|uniref:Uncharacterized protein n=1 Tax=Forsythia ovata TaxID=205694 RepID=A0ABD1Q9R7_9LAMI
MAFKIQPTKRESFLPNLESERWPNTPAPRKFSTARYYENKEQKNLRTHRLNQPNLIFLLTNQSKLGRRGTFRTADPFPTTGLKLTHTLPERRETGRFTVSKDHDRGVESPQEPMPSWLKRNASAAKIRTPCSTIATCRLCIASPVWWMCCPVGGGAAIGGPVQWHQ